ncbi:hypothetical protein EDD11_008148 [Mortierella claussenii]|nr:hypothetical protein EDD11_008148 [Mortierella claussenii]
MGKSAKFFKRPTRKEKAVLSLTKGTAETSLFDSAKNDAEERTGGRSKKDILSATANHTIAKKSKSSSSASSGSAVGAVSAHPPKASLAYKIQLNGGIKQAIKDMNSLNDDDDEDLMEEDEDMEDSHDTTATKSSSKKKKTEDLDKTGPRPDYIELMYGKPQSGNKRKTFMPKPALIK